MLYRHFDETGALLYVGISLSAITRLRQHRDRSVWFSQIKSITITQFETRADAKIAEKAAIQTEHPVYNKDWNKLPKEPKPRTKRRKIECSECATTHLTKYKRWCHECDRAYGRWHRAAHHADYVVRDRAWKLLYGPRQTTETPEARRARYLRDKDKKLV